MALLALLRAAISSFVLAAADTEFHAVDEGCMLQMPIQADIAAQVTSTGCDLMVLTTFFSTKKAWEWDSYWVPTFQLMQQFYESAIEQKINVTVLYDELPEDILQRATEHFKFELVDLNDFDADEGLNDVRFGIAQDLIRKRPEWKNVFLVDLFDMKVGMNPCGQIQEGKLYVGSQEVEMPKLNSLDVGIHDVRLSHDSYMDGRFDDMGGKYEAWVRSIEQPWPILNAGITGGRRDVYLRFLGEMMKVLEDPELKIRKLHAEENVNMAALNYVVRKAMNLTEDAEEGTPGFISGAPVHSVFSHYEANRKDVWFIHK